MFPVAALANYHKLGGLKQQKFILSQAKSPEVQNQFHWSKIKGSAGYPPSGGSRIESIPCLLRCAGCWHSLACGHIIPVFKDTIFKCLRLHMAFSSVSASNPSLLPLMITSVITFKATWIIQDNLSILRSLI